MSPKCANCQRVFNGNHCSQCQACNGTGHSPTCPRNTDNVDARRRR